MQRLLSAASYWRKPYNKNYSKYLEDTEFFPFLNNEIPHLLSHQYKERILNLNRLTLIEFGSDRTIFPGYSELFLERNKTKANFDIGLDQL